MRSVTFRYRQLLVPWRLSKRRFSPVRAPTSLENFYQPQIPRHLRYCLAQLEKEWMQRQPLKDKTVLLNMHLTGITLAVIDILFKTQAVVEVTVSPELVKQDHAQHALMAAGIPVLTDIPEHKKTRYYDIIYDCGAGMRQLIPRLGRVELTQTHPALYENLNFPVITVDHSLTKSIETGLGTGDSLVRLINRLARQSITTLMGLRIVNTIFENLPCEVDLAETGEEGVALCWEHHYDWVIFDMGLPGQEVSSRSLPPALIVLLLGPVVLKRPRFQRPVFQKYGCDNCEWFLG